MQIVRNITDLRECLGQYRKEGRTIGFAPTMGALHDGHVSLVDIARKNADKVVVSIFVNPAQFAPHEDFDKYPRTQEADLEKLRQHKTDVVYLPTRTELYPEGFDLKISTGSIGKELEGVARPHFFDGVALVVTKLFMHVMPDVAVFGQKDFQQLHVIEKLVRGFDMPIKIIGAPIMREDDGLAMSSRNVYLSPQARKTAAKLYKTLNDVREKLQSDADINEVLAWGRAALVEAGFERVDYIELRDGVTLMPATDAKISARLLAAVYLEKVRLIDNIACFCA
ncbi:MAG: pantoate/beta-alanine ligase [Rickettsiaceae bacterium]|jgi:pantoate--beta-alanine ligase|nr:pantoate/beta-alanine ligase [Rickettsiaceae bacterium]